MIPHANLGAAIPTGGTLRRRTPRLSSWLPSPFWAQQSIEERGHHRVQFPRLVGFTGVERFA
jgi:hypothetical protein